ncbi:winged helix DNA-binding domain-containing protein [Ilumatobacter sp.]|uniref:winged helix DNA-binding domain-containing protein n=1 Tax=Ilumatobacter sp. TaxID=1967498 RepID=UPI003B520375
MSTSAGTRLVRALRLRHQGLVAGRRWPSIPSTVAGMLALQAQDRTAATAAISLRTDGRPDGSEVLASLAEGTIVRNRPSRGTLQITAPEDLRWLSALQTPRSIAAAVKRRSSIGVTAEMVAEVERIVRSELAGGATRTRGELVAACAAAGTELDGSQAGHVLRHLTEAMAIVFAEPRGRDDAFALADAWIADPRRAEGDAALAELAIRFVTARGPVTPACLGWWSNLAMGDVRRGIDVAGDALEHVEIDGAAYLVPTGAADLGGDDVEAALAEPLLLPAFDEYLLGYRSRDAVLDDAHAALVVPGRNGVFRPIVVVDGEVVATWSATAKTTELAVSIQPFGGSALDGAALDGPVLDGLGRRVVEHAAFLGRTADPTVERARRDDGAIAVVAQSTSR